MSTANKGPTLTDATGMGGVRAQEGFDYQLWVGLIRLPAWLRNPAFEEIIFEGLEDFEARFFAPQSPRRFLLERYQAKSGQLTPAEVAEVFETFRAFDQAHPNAARTHTLITPTLPSTLRWTARDPSRIRRARPFYAPFSDIVAASDDKLKDDMARQFGAPLGAFVATSVEVMELPLPDRRAAVAMFGQALIESFPAVDPSPRRVDAAFEALCALARESVGVPLPRARLIEAIEAAIEAPLSGQGPFRLALRSDRTGTDETVLEIDASAFRHGDQPCPDASRWSTDLVEPLCGTATWLRSRGITRLAFEGSFRLTTGFALGWAFRSAVGFEIEIRTRAGVWMTDDHARLEETYPAWQPASKPRRHDGTLIVSVGVVQDPAVDVARFAGVPRSEVLALWSANPIASARQLQHAVASVKAAVSNAAAELGAERIDLFLLGSLAFAVALGHRWNRMPPTRLHEFIASDRSYVASATLG